MLLDLSPYTDPLSRTPAVLRAILDGRPDAWLDSRHAPDVVSPRETVAHLLLCEAEASWMMRLRRILDPEYVFPTGPYADLEDADLTVARSLPDLLNEFDSARTASIRELQDMRLTADDVEKQLTREGFGSTSVGQLLSTWVAHDLYHLGQVFKSYSALYVGQIGPYQKYLNLPHFN